MYVQEVCVLVNKKGRVKDVVNEIRYRYVLIYVLHSYTDKLTEIK